MNKKSTSKRLNNEGWGIKGFTLIELLIVVVILSSIAFASLSLLGNNNEQVRFEDTRNRLKVIRKAILGQPGRTVNGMPEISGFVSDMGRLPQNIQELLTQPTDCDPVTAGPQTCNWSYDDITNLTYGWNGPYLVTLSEVGGSKAYRDGWGTSGTAPDYGWSVTLTDIDGDVAPDEFDDTLTIQSFGVDGSSVDADLNSFYDNDYPPSGALVERKDHRIDFETSGLTIEFNNYNDGGGDVVMATYLCVRIYYPTNGVSINSRASKKANLSTPVTLMDGQIHEITFTFPTASGTKKEQWIPAGVRAVGVYEWDNTTPPGECGSTNRYPSSNTPLRTMSFIPRVSKPIIEWSVE